MSKFEGVIKSGVSQKTGKGYATIRIDGAEYLAFDPYVSVVRSISAGSEIEFTSKPNANGGPAFIGTLKVLGAGTNSGGVQQPVASGVVVPPSSGVSYSGGGSRGAGSGGRNDDVVQLSIFYGYAKDLVTHGILKASVGTSDAVIDLIGSVALHLMATFKKSKENLANPTT